MRLDVYLAGVVGSHAEAQRLIDAGLVRVDGVVRPKRFMLSGGETVDVAESAPEPVADVPPRRSSGSPTRTSTCS